MDFEGYLDLCQYDYDVSRDRNRSMQYHLLIQTTCDDSITSYSSVRDLAKAYLDVCKRSDVIGTHVFYGYVLNSQVTHKTDVGFGDDTKTFFVSYELSEP